MGWLGRLYEGKKKKEGSTDGAFLVVSFSQTSIRYCLTPSARRQATLEFAADRNINHPLLYEIKK